MRALVFTSHFKRYLSHLYSTAIASNEKTVLAIQKSASTISYNLGWYLSESSEQ